MKKTKYFVSMLFVIAMLFVQCRVVSAKELEYCRQCNGTRAYFCAVCNNAGKVICDGCGGTKGSKCTGDSYKGNPCDNGYYTCPSCAGDGKRRTGDGMITEGFCGNCDGEGKLRCVTCSVPGNAPGWLICHGCDEDGKSPCQRCIPAREIGYKCPHCKGTGYILVGFGIVSRPELNDGIKNIPEVGDHIIIDDEWHHIVYGYSAEAVSSDDLFMPEIRKKVPVRRNGLFKEICIF